jgi:glycosyltransferase involved in cell wall biosynthesis
MKQLKIWLVNQYAAPPNIPGLTRHFELCREWAREQKAKVTLFTSKFTHPRRVFLSEEEKAQVEKVENMKIKWFWSYPHQKNDFKRILNMMSFTTSFFFNALFSRKPDVFVASSPQLFQAYAGLLVARIRRIPFVFEVRDLWPDSLVKMGGLGDGKVLKMMTWMEKELYEKADKIIVLAEFQRTFISKMGIPLEKIELIPNGVVVGSYNPKPDNKTEYRKKMGVPEDEFLAIYTGAHGPANDLDTVVRAGQYLSKGTSIVCIGEGPEKERLLKLKAELGVDNVHMLDPIPKTEIFNYTDASDVGIICLTDNEVFRGARPNKLFDYTFLGKPIVTTVDGEVRHIIEDNKVGIFSGAENPEGLARAIEEVRTYSPERLAEIKHNGYEFIDREGNRQKSAKKYYGILEELSKKK